MDEIVIEFEKQIAKFYGAPYAVATDCCTHGMELSLRYLNVQESSCPSRTYLSIPFMFEKLNIKWKFENIDWKDYYYLGNTNIIDAAVHWKPNGYIPNTYMCLSFQFRKHLNLIRGGAVLVDNLESYTALAKMTRDGRSLGNRWKEQDIECIGYHYYMPAETAQLGLERLPEAIARPPQRVTSLDYPYLPDLTVFKNLTA
jgi:dTDP-4-amino-4,6-dideoxygalactose transaminase